MDLEEKIRSEPNLMIQSKCVDTFHGFSSYFTSLQRSFNDTREFNPRGGKVIRNSLPKGRVGGKGKKGNNRPGKASRDKARANRKK